MLAASCTAAEEGQGQQGVCARRCSLQGLSEILLLPKAFNPVRAQLWAHHALPTTAENVSFPSEHSSREHKQNEGVGLSNAALALGRGFTLGISWHVQTSQAQQCHPHPKTRHQEETHAPRASLPTGHVVTLLSLCQPTFPPCPKNSLLCVNTGIQVGLTRHCGSSQLDLFPHPTPPPTTENKCSFWLHQPQRFVLD